MVKEQSRLRVQKVEHLMTMRLYDTAQAAVIDIELDEQVRMYVCGITPYDSTHLGHAATYLSYDLLIRRLEDLGHTVQLVRNVTDVDDSILPKARELGIDFLELAEMEMDRCDQDMVALNTRRADAEPRATESIDDMIKIIEKLVDRGHTYTTEGTTYFDISTFPDFVKLSHLNEQEMVVLAAERGGRPDDPKQKNPLDFVLWQPSADDEPSLESPFGTGRPGWHIECSAMSMRALGPTIDIPGGGADLISPIMSVRLRKVSRSMVNRFLATGFMQAWWPIKEPKCPNLWATWCSFRNYEKKLTLERFGGRAWLTTIAPTLNGLMKKDREHKEILNS